MLAWGLLLIAGLLEVVWAIGLKRSAGFTLLWPSIATITAMLASFFLLARAMQTLPLGISYTVWVGIGAVGSVIAGAALLQERLTIPQIACVALIIVGIAGLKLTAPSSPPAPSAPSAPDAPPPTR